MLIYWQKTLFGHFLEEHLIPDFLSFAGWLVLFRSRTLAALLSPATLQPWQLLMRIALNKGVLQFERKLLSEIRAVFLIGASG